MPERANSSPLARLRAVATSTLPLDVCPPAAPLTAYLVLGCRPRKAGGRKSAIPLRAGRNSCGEHGGLHLRHGASASCLRSSVVGAVLACLLRGRVTSGKIENFSSSARSMREPGGLERRPATRTRHRTPEDHATPPRWSATAQTALPGRGRLVGRSARFNQKCTTCKPRGPDDASQDPRAPGDHPAYTSWPRVARAGRGKRGGK